MEGTGSLAPRLRLERLQHVTSALSRAATLDEVTDVMLTTVTEELAAQAVLLALVTEDGAGLEIVRAVGYLPATLEQWRTFPLAAPLPAGDALRQRRMVVFESLEQRDVAYPVLRGQPAAHEAFAIVPLLADGDRPLGIVSFGFDRARGMEDGERAFVQAVADQCAHAIFRARLYDEQRTAARQRGFLNRAAQRFAEAPSYRQVLQRVTDVAVPELADGAVLYVPGPGGLEAAASAHADSHRRARLRRLTKRRALTSDPTLEQVLGTGRPVSVRIDRLLREHGDAHVEALRTLGTRSARLLPLRPRNVTVGVLALLAGEGRQFTDADRSLADSYATIAALHCDNAHLLEQQTRIARRLQASLLPPALPSIPGLEIAASYAAAGSASEVGGDFYDVFRAGPGHWLVVTGDVRGRGVEAAATTGLARHTIRAAGLPEASPSAVVRRLNEVLLADDSDEEPQPEPRFCAACVTAVTLQPGGVGLTVCCAGHPLPRLVRADGAVMEVGVPGTVAGVLAEPDLADVTLTLSAGDTLVLFTDGISDRHASGEFFEDRLAAILTGAPERDAKAVAEGLLDEAKGFAAGHDDDMAVLVLRVIHGGTDD